MSFYFSAKQCKFMVLSLPSQELPRFKELIFEDLSRFLLVENMYEEVVLQSVTKEIMMGEIQKTPRFRISFHGDDSRGL